jgi:hypothetical protein
MKLGIQMLPFGLLHGFSPSLYRGDAPALKIFLAITIRPKISLVLGEINLFGMFFANG